MIKVKFENPNSMSTDDINESFISTSLDMSSNYFYKLQFIRTAKQTYAFKPQPFRFLFQTLL